MKIAGLQRVTLLDYPDRIAATVFLAGCNLNCGYCHNRWMIDAERAPEALSFAELIEWLATRQGRLDGVCISGGEPTLQADLPELLRAIKALGFGCKLDTNGFAPGRLGALLDEGLLDYVALDLKAPFDGRYAAVTGVSVDLDRLRQSLALLRGGVVTYELRTTAGPQLDVVALEAIAAEILPGELWILQPFLSAETVSDQVRDLPALNLSELLAIGTRLRERGWRVEVRGE